MTYIEEDDMKRIDASSMSCLQHDQLLKPTYFKMKSKEYVFIWKELSWSIGNALSP